MIDIKLLRENPEEIKKSVAKKGYKLDTDAILVLDKTRRQLIQEIEELRKEGNEIASQGKDANREKGKDIKEKIKVKEGELKGVEEQFNERMMEIPNPPLDDVPEGESEEDNKVIGEWGDIPKFDFKPKDHVELGEELDIIDFKTGAKVAGSQFYYLKNEGAMLELALINYSLNLLREKGYTILITPDLAHEKFYKGTGYMPKGDEAQTYEIEDSNLGLIATSEITLAAYHADEILKGKDLPIKYVGLSHCFRKEAGAYGAYSKGLYRVHQFTKVEMFVFSNTEDSPKIHEELLSLEKEIFNGLDIPFRVVEMCTADLGAQAVKKYDLEAWMPGRDDWGEITSTSNTTDYQSRNLNIRYKDGKEINFVHTLNGTAIAASRVIVAILENFQQKDGSVEIPKALHGYLPFTRIEKGK
jgi:seryl-tRNA synthetase